MENLKEKIQTAVNIYKSGNLVKAEEISKKLIKANPRVIFLYNLLGLIFTGQKKIKEAIECYEKGLKIDPKYAMIYNNLGLLYFNTKSTDKELIERFNSGANCYGWPRARMIVIYCLIQEMKKRFDLSEISHITTCISRFMGATWSEQIFLKNKKVYITK